METLFGYLQSGFSAVIPFIILLGILIFVHELGHFLVARWNGVRVEVFSLGFGKKILQYKKGDTVYCLSIIPLGGYVKMFGDELGKEITEEEKKFAFTHKTVGQRIAVVLAGPLMNFFFAILLFFTISLVGEEMRSPVVGDISQGTYAYDAGFRSGDKILKVDDQIVTTWNDFQEYIAIKHDQNLTIEVSREFSGEIQNFKATPTLEPNPNILSHRDYIGDIKGLNFNSKSSVVAVSSTQSAAYLAGLRSGDRIAQVNEQKISYYRELPYYLQKMTASEYTFKVERYDASTEKVSEHTFQLQLTENNSENKLQSWGIDQPDLYLANVVPASPAEAAGLKINDRLVQIKGIAIQRWEDVLTAIKSFDGTAAIEVNVLRDGQPMSFSMTPQMTTHMTQMGSEEKRYTIGIQPLIALANPETMIFKSESIGAAAVRGVEKTWDITTMTVISFLRLIQNKISPKNIGGVISIGQAAKETFKIGFSQFITMMAIISVNLFVLNLLPIPVLDGGHLLFYTIEAIKGAPVSMRKMEIAQQVGLVLLMSLMVFALFNDFSRLLS